ncbi:MAG: o-succinylbenzoate synthase [Janthinobacterium lividum]
MLALTYQRRTLHFNFPARTSRGALTEHVVYYLGLHDTRRPEVIGWGEAAPLAGLSPDYNQDFETQVQQLCERLSHARLPELTPAQAAEWVPAHLPALRFALETAALDLATGGRHQLYHNAFSQGQAGIPINGLVWMGDAAFMREQIRQKLAAGYSCLKLKIGSLDFATELALLAEIRAEAGPDKLVLRVDANGAFAPAEALGKLDQLARFDIHSIEQPLAAGNWPALAQVCRQSPIPVALDEELIGITDPARQQELVAELQPAYLVLKPTLLGGHAATRRWISLARQHGLGWWITSALESNIGLNAVAQLTGEHEVAGFAQGLGTGQLYHQNVAAPLHIWAGYLHYEPAGEWSAALQEK